MTLTKIHYTTRFIKDLKKLSKDKQKVAIAREKLFREDPFAPTLKTHKLTGKLAGLWAFSLTYHDRVIFKFINKTEVIFFKIGSHAIYDR